MRYYRHSLLIGISLLASTAICASAPAFQQDDWTGFVRNDDLYNGCIMGQHVTNDVYILLYANSSGTLNIGVSSPALDKEIDEEVAGTITFDDDEPLHLIGRMIEKNIALLPINTDQVDIEPLLRSSRQVRLTYDHHKLGLALRNTKNAIDLLWDCANKSAQDAETQVEQNSKDFIKKVITGVIKHGKLDSAIEDADTSYGFMTRSPDGDKIFQACKMDERCKVTALIKPGSEFIETVISVEKLSDAKSLPRQTDTNIPLSSSNKPREIPFYTRGNWGISILNRGDDVPYCLAWNFQSARYIQNIPRVQDQIEEAITSCKKYITDNPDIFSKFSN